MRYVRDLVPFGDSLTIHGAFSHWPRGASAEGWKAIINAGEDIYLVAIRQVVFHSNDYEALPRLVSRAAELGVDPISLDGPVSRDDVERLASRLWKAERRADIGYLS